MRHFFKIAALGIVFPTLSFTTGVRAQEQGQKQNKKTQTPPPQADTQKNTREPPKEGQPQGKKPIEQKQERQQGESSTPQGEDNVQDRQPGKGQKGAVPGGKEAPEATAAKPTPTPAPGEPFQLRIPRTQTSVSSLRPEGVYGHLFKSALNLLKKEMSAQEENPQFQRAVLAEVERSRRVLQRQLGLQLSKLKIKAVSGPSPFIKMKNISFLGRRGAIKRPDSLTSRRRVILQAVGREGISLLGPQTRTITKDKLLFERHSAQSRRAQLYALDFKNHDEYRVVNDAGYIPYSALGCLHENAIAFLYPSVAAGGVPKVHTNPRRLYYYSLKKRQKVELWKRGANHWGTIATPVTHSSDCKTFVFNLPLRVRGTTRKYGEVVLVSEAAKNSWINTSMAKTGASTTEVLRFAETSLMKKKGDVVPTVAVLDNKREILWFFVPEKKNTFKGLQWRRVRLPLPDGMSYMRSLAQSEKGDVLYFTYSSYDEDAGTQTSGVALVNAKDIEAGPKKIVESSHYLFNSVAAHPSGQRLVVSFSSGKKAGVGEIIPAGKRAAFWVVEWVPPFHTLNTRHQAVPRYNTAGNFLIFQRIQGERYQSHKGNQKSQFPMEFVSWEVVGNNHF